MLVVNFFSSLCLLFLGVSSHIVESRLGGKVYWNVPTFQCDSHKLNFTDLAVKYNILQNKDDRFRGEDIVILYDPGNFPAILTQGSKVILRNGGVPQEGNLTLHLGMIERHLEELIPNQNFSGVGVLDFESWRPIFRQNFGVLQLYKNLSIKIEGEKHPFWPKSWVEKEARQSFEKYGRIFMEETLKLVKRLRPRASWGYYAYPYCFNMSPNNMRRGCPKEVLQENDAIRWLFKLQDNFYPSLYLGKTLTLENKVDLVEGRVGEALRIKKNSEGGPKKIIPYYWYKYHDSHEFLSQEDAFTTLTVLGSLDIDGLVIWGSSNDVNTRKKCHALYDYIDKTLGPLLVNNIY